MMKFKRLSKTEKTRLLIQGYFNEHQCKIRRRDLFKELIKMADFEVTTGIFSGITTKILHSGELFSPNVRYFKEGTKAYFEFIQNADKAT